MSENIAVKATFTADDKASPIIRGLIRDLERLGKLRTSIAPIKLVDDKETGKINAAASAVERLAAANRQLAETARKANRPNLRGLAFAQGGQGAAYIASVKASGAAATQAVQMASAATQRASRIDEAALGRRLAGLRLTSRLMTAHDRQEEKSAADAQRRARVDLDRRLAGIRQQGRIMAAHGREQDRFAAVTGRQMRAGFRQFAQSPARMADRLSGLSAPAVGGAIGVAAAARLARSGIAGRMDADAAETNARIFGGMTPQQVRDARGGWIDRAAVENGIKPSAAINAATESLKAGVDLPNLRGITETILRATTALDLDVTETTRLVGRIGTLRHSFDPTSTSRILNSVAISARDTAADSNEIIAGMRRGAGALGASKMTPDELSAFVAVGSSVGMAPQKAGTFMDYIVNQLVNARSERGQRRNDLSRASVMAHLGGLGSVSMQTSNDPAGFLQKLLDKMAKLDERKRAEVAHYLAGREWSGELLQMVQGRETLRSTLKNIADPKNADFLKEAQRQKMGSMAGKLGQLKTIGSLAWESVGVGLSDAFDKVVTFFTKLGSPDRFQAISGATKAAVDGLAKGLGFDNVTALLESTFGGSKDRIGKFGESLGQFFRGVGEGARTLWSIAKPILAALGGTDPQSIGTLVAQLTGLSLALSILRPVVSVFGLITDGLRGLGGLLTMGLAMRGGAGLLGFAGMGGAAALANPIGLTILAGGALAVAVMNWESIRDALTPWSKDQLERTGIKTQQADADKMRNRRKEAESQGYRPLGEMTTWEMLKHLFRRTSAGQGEMDRPGLQKGALGPTINDFSRDVRRLGAEIEKSNFRAAFGDARVQLASLSGMAQARRNFGGGGLPTSLASPSIAGVARGNGAVDAGGYGPRGSIGGLSPELAERIAPNTGPASRGSSRGPGGPSDAAERAARPSATVERFANSKGFSEKGASVMARLQHDFGLTRTQAAAVVGNLGHESKGLQAINEEKPMIPGSRGGFGWAQWTGKRRRAFEAWTQANGLDPRSDEANYGFLKHELTGSHASALRNLKAQTDPYAAMHRFEADYEGSGVKNYPSRWKWTLRALGLPEADASKLAGATPSSGDLASSAPSAGQLAASVPPPQGFAGSRLNPMAGSGSSPHVNININGHNGDPEALANQVQKRINENMKWRTHDVEFDV